MLGIQINIAIAGQHASNGDWTTYAADISRKTSQHTAPRRHETQVQE